jgi:hypothetical protein
MAKAQGRARVFLVCVEREHYRATGLQSFHQLFSDNRYCDAVI